VQGGHDPSLSHAGQAQPQPVLDEPPMHWLVPSGAVSQHVTPPAPALLPVPDESGVEYQPTGHGYTHATPDGASTPPSPRGSVCGGGAAHAPLPSSGQHVRGSGYVVVPFAHCVKGAFGYATQAVCLSGPDSQQTLGCAAPKAHAVAGALTSPTDTGCDVLLRLPFDTLPLQAAIRAVLAPMLARVASHANGRIEL
jgi:hypothetical protein